MLNRLGCLVTKAVYQLSSSNLPIFRFAAAPSERDTFYLTMLASIEVAHHKGNDVLVQAMNKVQYLILYYLLILKKFFLF